MSWDRCSIHGRGGCTSDGCARETIHALRADLARVTAERDEARQQVEVLSEQLRLQQQLDQETSGRAADEHARYMAEVRAESGVKESQIERAEAQAAALRNVLEDCHAHDLYVSEGAEASRLFRKAHGSDWGRVKDESAHDHDRSMRAAISGELGGEMLLEVRSLRQRVTDLAAERDEALRLADLRLKAKCEGDDFAAQLRVQAGNERNIAKQRERERDEALAMLERCIGPDLSRLDAVYGHGLAMLGAIGTLNDSDGEKARTKRNQIQDDARALLGRHGRGK